jgi:hypothetical protein
MEPRDRNQPAMSPPRRLRHSDTHRRDRANNRVRRTTQVSVAAAAVATGALVGMIAHDTVAAKVLPASPAGSGTGSQASAGTSAGLAAGNTPTPAASQPPSTTTTTQAPSVSPSQDTAPTTTVVPPTTTFVPSTPIYSPPVVSTGGS